MIYFSSHPQVRIARRLRSSEDIQSSVIFEKVLLFNISEGDVWLKAQQIGICFAYLWYKILAYSVSSKKSLWRKPLMVAQAPFGNLYGHSYSIIICKFFQDFLKNRTCEPQKVCTKSRIYDIIRCGMPCGISLLQIFFKGTY